MKKKRAMGRHTQKEGAADMERERKTVMKILSNRERKGIRKETYIHKERLKWRHKEKERGIHLKRY